MTSPSDESTGRLIAQATEDISTLIRAEMQLAKDDLAQAGKRVGVGAGLFGAAGVIALYGLGVLISAAVLGLANVTDPWLAALIVAVVLFAVVLMGFGALTPTTTVQAVSDCAITDAEAGRACTDADPVTPAKQAGLQPGDRFVSFNGERITSWEQLSGLIRANGDREARLVVDRDGREVSADVPTAVLARTSLDDPQRTEKVGFLGVTPTETMQRQGPGAVVDVMSEQVAATASAIAHLPVRMVEVTKAAFGAERPADGPISVVGASRVAGELVTVDEPSWAERAQRLLALLASLNLFLALFNFIPLLPLDGGHIAGALWEAVRRGWARLRRRPDPGYVDVARMLPVAYVVGGILMVMSVILIYADIVNPVSIS